MGQVQPADPLIFPGRTAGNYPKREHTMSETTPVPTDATPKPTPPAQGDEGEQTPTVEIDWKTKAREWERRAKDNKTAADELATIKESQKSEAEKATERLAVAERKVAEAEARVLRRDVAIEYKLTKGDAAIMDTITGEDDALRALAVRLGGQAADDNLHGNRVPREGTTNSQSGGGDDLEVVRNLFAG